MEKIVCRVAERSPPPSSWSRRPTEFVASFRLSGWRSSPNPAVPGAWPRRCTLRRACRRALPRQLADPAGLRHLAPYELSATVDSQIWLSLAALLTASYKLGSACTSPLAHGRPRAGAPHCSPETASPIPTPAHAARLARRRTCSLRPTAQGLAEAAGDVAPSAGSEVERERVRGPA